MSINITKPNTGFTAEGQDYMQIRNWNNVDLFDTLNKEGVMIVRHAYPSSGEHILASLLTLQAQNRQLSQRVYNLEKQLTQK